MSSVSQRLIDVHSLLPVRVAFRGIAPGQSGILLILLLEQDVGPLLGTHGWPDGSRMGDNSMTVASDDRLLQGQGETQTFYTRYTRCSHTDMMVQMEIFLRRVRTFYSFSSSMNHCDAVLDLLTLTRVCDLNNATWVWMFYLQ